MSAAPVSASWEAIAPDGALPDEWRSWLAGETDEPARRVREIRRELQRRARRAAP